MHAALFYTERQKAERRGVGNFGEQAIKFIAGLGSSRGGALIEPAGLLK